MMFNAREYWNTRYRSGGNSGAGSYGDHSKIKSDYVNGVIKDYNIETVDDIGVGDGNQLSMLNVLNYIGYDISDVILDKVKSIYKNDPTKTFRHVDLYHDRSVDLMLSMEVIFHLIDDTMYLDYMDKLFNSNSKYILIFTMSGNDGDVIAPHVKIRDILKLYNVRYYNDWECLDVHHGFDISKFYLFKRKFINLYK